MRQVVKVKVELVCDMHFPGWCARSEEGGGTKHISCIHVPPRRPGEPSAALDRCKKRWANLANRVWARKAARKCAGSKVVPSKAATLLSAGWRAGHGPQLPAQSGQGCASRSRVSSGSSVRGQAGPWGVNLVFSPLQSSESASVSVARLFLGKWVPNSAKGRGGRGAEWGEAQRAPFSVGTERGVAWGGWFHYCLSVVCRGDRSSAASATTWLRPTQAAPAPLGPLRCVSRMADLKDKETATSLLQWISFCASPQLLLRRLRALSWSRANHRSVRTMRQASGLVSDGWGGLRETS